MTGSANMPCIAALPISFSLSTLHTLIMKTVYRSGTPSLHKIPLLLIIVFLFSTQPASLAASNPVPGIKPDSIPAVKLPCYPQFEKEMIRTACSIASHATSIQGGVVNYVARVAKVNRRFYICLNKQYPHAKN